MELRSVGPNQMCKRKMISETFVEYLVCTSTGLVFRSVQKIQDVNLPLRIPHYIVPTEKDW